MKFSHTINAELLQLQDGISFIEDSLKKCACKSTDIARATLLIEEMLVLLIQKSNASQKIQLTVSKSFGNTKIHLSSEGDRIDEEELNDAHIDFQRQSSILMRKILSGQSSYEQA